MLHQSFLGLLVHVPHFSVSLYEAVSTALTLSSLGYTHEDFFSIVQYSFTFAHLADFFFPHLRPDTSE